jgi:primary-amine oxidase
MLASACLVLLSRRFSIGQNNRVSWLGWQLYVGYLPHYGPRYMDVRFKGERIAYEISMQEALACE